VQEPGASRQATARYWSENEGDILGSLKDAVGADDAVGAFHQALSFIVLEATGQKLSREEAESIKLALVAVLRVRRGGGGGE